MSLYNSDQKIGIELELYNDDGVCGMERYLRSHNTGLSVCSDGSLSDDGSEVKFDSGVELRNALPRIEQLHRIAIDADNSLFTSFAVDDNGYQNDEYLGNANVEYMSGETGLHIHFGMPIEFLALDIIRLIKNFSDDIVNVRKKSWRINERWACSPLLHMVHLQNMIERALLADPNDINATTFSFVHEKYTGVNLCNINWEHCNTIEFRFAHGSLMTDMNAFNDYLATLKGHWDNSFTGSREMVLGNLKLKEITPSGLHRRKAIRVFNNDTGEELGKFRIKFN